MTKKCPEYTCPHPRSPSSDRTCLIQATKSLQHCGEPTLSRSRHPTAVTKHFIAFSSSSEPELESLSETITSLLSSLSIYFYYLPQSIVLYSYLPPFLRSVGNLMDEVKTSLLLTSTPGVSTCLPLCTMAFYSYVMMKYAHVGIEAILHMVRKQHDRSMIELGIRFCLLYICSARLTCSLINVTVFCLMFPCSKATFMLIFQMMS